MSLYSNTCCTLSHAIPNLAKMRLFNVFLLTVFDHIKISQGTDEIEGSRTEIACDSDFAKKTLQEKYKVMKDETSKWSKTYKDEAEKLASFCPYSTNLGNSLSGNYFLFQMYKNDGNFRLSTARRLRWSTTLLNIYFSCSSMGKL